MSSRGMDAEKSSLCNFVVDFLLRENYLLTAFELLHELVEDGRHDQAIRLRDFFSDSSVFPPDQIARYNSLRVADPQCLLEEKETLQEKLAFSEYELRLAQEDILKLKEELQKKTQHSSSETDGFPTNHSSVYEGKMGNQGISVDLGSLKDEERQVLNCAVKEYLMIAGYRLTAMTFYEEVADQNLDIWPKSPASVTDALRHYFYQYLSSTTDAAEEKISILQERDRLLEEIEHLKFEKESLLKSNGLAETQLSSLTRLLETAQKEIKDKDILKSLEFQRKDLNDCRAEITSLKMYIESSRAGQHWVGDRTEQAQPRVNEESSILREAESSKKDQVSDEQEDITAASKSAITEEDVCHDNSNAFQTHSDDLMNSPVVTPEPQVISCNENGDFETRNGSYEYHSIPSADTNAGKPGLEAIHILSDALPKIVPYVLINHREELLPLIMCAIERHPESGQRDLLTHTLFNLIKRPDEQQRRIIMDACVILAKNVGEMRTETELLPQCWEQINHKYEERRLLVAQSCGQLAEFVRPEIRDSLILSIVQQLVEDPSAIVRQAASHNLALLLPCFPNVDKYFKVEELAYQLLCDPSGLVVETSLKELIPSLINWGNNLDHLVRVSLSHLLSSAERCPPLSGVEISVESHLRFLGERERWNIEVLLRMLTEVIPFIYAEAVKTCPFVDEALASPQAGKSFFSPPLLDMYARGHADWPSLDWLHAECVPDLIRLSCFLPTREDHLRAKPTIFEAMGTAGSGGVALQTLRLASSLSAFRGRAIPLSTSLFAPAAAKPTPTALIVRAFSASAVHAAPVATEDGKVSAGKPRWKAAIDFKWIRDNKDVVAANIEHRNSSADLELVLELYDKYCGLQKEVERLRAERNAVANKMKGKLEPPVRQALVEEGKSLKEKLVSLEEELIHVTDSLQIEAQCIPNITHPSVPVGGEEKSVQRKLVGCPREFGFTIKDHVQIGRDLDLFDFDAASEISGSKFYYLKNEAVLLEMALVNWALSEVSKRGFIPLITPELVRSSVVEKCGFQPRGQNTQVYSIEGSDQCLIGTAEIPVGGLHMDSIIADSSLPLKYVAFSHCFRTEAGAAGTATRGLYRVHQFSKVEMFILCRPEDSDRFHEELIRIEEELFESLGLHFKTLEMSSEDLGAPAYRKFDVEAWMPGVGRYGEISSASNCTDYQSRRLGIRYRPSSLADQESAGGKKGKTSSAAATQFVHTLNATACAVPRMILCLLENFQQEDGSVIIPEPLRPFMGGLSVISPKPR